LIGNIQLALLERIDPVVKEYLEQAQIGGEILLHFINNILDSGKASTGNLGVSCNSDCNIFGICEQLWAISRRIVSHKKLNGILKIHEHVPNFLKLDPYRLTQIMLNLIGNAVKFTTKGRVNVELKWMENQTNINESLFEPIPYEEIDEGLFEKNQTSLFYLDDEGAWVLHVKDAHFHNRLIPQYAASRIKSGVLKITVSDTGCGIPSESLKDIFGKFVQLNTEAIKRHVGSGRDSTTKEIVKKLNGEIRAFSKVGKGTTFIICIPCKSAKPPELRLSRSSEVSTFSSKTVRGNLRVLVVDDVPWNNQIIANYVQKVGGTPIIALNGAEAYEKYEESHRQGNPFDVVAMDYDMPVMNGYEALRKIRVYERENNLLPTLAIVISGHCDHNIISECLDSHGDVRANYFLKKPITFKQLLDVLSKV